MKYFLVFLVVCVAVATAAPQLLWGGWPGAGIVGPRTVVAGPTVVNPGYPGVAGLTTLGLGGRLIAPGVINPWVL